MKNMVSKLRWFEVFAPTARMFHGLGNRLGRGRGAKLAEAPVSLLETGESEVWRKEKVLIAA